MNNQAGEALTFALVPEPRLTCRRGVRIAAGAKIAKGGGGHLTAAAEQTEGAPGLAGRGVSRPRLAGRQKGEKGFFF